MDEPDASEFVKDFARSHGCHLGVNGQTRYRKLASMCEQRAQYSDRAAAGQNEIQRLSSE